MPCDDPGSITRWIAALKAGQAAAVQPLGEHDLSRVVELAQVKLRSVRCRDDGDEEETALSAFDCL